jgi:hypothetical protein
VWLFAIKACREVIPIEERHGIGSTMVVEAAMEFDLVLDSAHLRLHVSAHEALDHPLGVHGRLKSQWGNGMSKRDHRSLSFVILE